MLTDGTLIAAVATLTISLATFWSNPHRLVNRAFLSLSINVAIWLLVLRKAFEGGEGLIWLRTASAVGACFVPQLAFLKDCVVAPTLPPAVRIKRFTGWIAFAVAMAVLSFTEYFIPASSSPDQPIYGPGYYLYLVGVVTGYVVLCLNALFNLKNLQGVQRVELQLLLLGGSIAAISSLTLIGVSAGLRDPAYVRIMPFTVLAFYFGTAWLITTTKLFDARHVLRFGLQRLLLILAAAAMLAAAERVLVLYMPPVFAFVLATGLAIWATAEINPWLQGMLLLNTKGTGDARRATFEAARHESRFERLEEAFVTVLKGWAKSDHAVVLFGREGRFQGCGLDISTDATPMTLLHVLRWVTPERLSRERTSEQREQLLVFMREHGFGAMVTSGRGKLSVVVAVGMRASRRPFTYPEITQLTELASIIENALARTHFSVKAQHAEQLATVGMLGASLAHEIRNPLVSIKAFVQLLPHHYQDQVFRDKFFSLIGEEVTRIDRLTEQLLDLAAPRSYTPAVVSLHPLLRSSLELVAAKSAEKSIRVITEFNATPDRVFTDSNAARQLLLNLCFNAIQALESQAGERWIKVSTRRLNDGFELAVADNGPGILPEIRARLFQPFQSSKSTGFGLGLAICSDIVSGLGATISADPDAPGAGATFRVVFPCQPPTS